MGYESDGSRFESSSEQVDASLSNDSIDAGNAEITELPEQYDFDESDVGEYIPEGELPEENQEGSIETTEIPEMSDSGSLESGEFDEDYFDESDVGEYDPEALNENIESSDDGIEVSYKESAELGDSAENDFDESDVGEYDPEIVEGEIDADAEADSDNYAEHADADTVETPEISELGEDADSIVMDEETESDEEDFEGASEEVEFDGENVEGTGEDTAFGEVINENTDEDFDVENADVPESADSVFEDIDGSVESIDESSEDTYEDAELNEWTTEDASDGTEPNADNPEEVVEDTKFSEEGSEGDDDDIESIEINSENTGEKGSDFVEDVSEDADESAESDDEGTENVGEGVASDDEANLEGEEDSNPDEEPPEDASESSKYDGESAEVIGKSVESSGEENLEGEEDSDSSEELPEVTDESSDFGTESVEDADEDAESDEDDSEVSDEHIESDEETSENGTESTESGGEKPEEDNAESSDEESEAIDENAEPDDETSEAEDENAESDSEAIESTASDEENVESEEGNTEFDEEAYEGEEDNTESGEEALEDVDEDVESSENSLEDENENTESTDESSEDADNDAESSEDVSVDESENVDPSDDNPEDVDDDTESSNETTENANEATESDGQTLEGASDGADPSGESLEGDNEDTESSEENTEDVDEDIESDDESSEKIDDGSEPSEEVSESESEDTESDNEALEDTSEKTESAENILENEDSEFCDENLENTDENTEFDEESSEGEGESIEFNEDAPEYTGEDAESSEEKLDNVDGDTELDGDTMDETGENGEPNGKTQESTDEAAASTEEQEKRQTADNAGEKADSDRKNEGIVPDADTGQQEWHSFIGATEKERYGGVMAMGMGAIASEVAAMRQEEIRQARNAETPDLHRGETVSTLREGHEQTIIAATEDRLEDNQPPEMFPEAQTETGVEKQPERDYTDEQPEEPSVDREWEKKTVADDGMEADHDQDAAGQIAQAAQAAAAGLGPGAPGGSTDGSGGFEEGSNDPGKPLSGPGEPKGASGSSGDGHSIEQAGSRVRVEIPLMNGHQLGPIPVGEALQFGQPLSQLQRLVNEVPIPTNEMQGDAALADMIARMGVPPGRLGFPGNTVTMEDVRVFRKSRGLRWLRFGDRKSLILVDASKKTYVQELREVAEPGDVEHETEREPQSKAAEALAEAVEVSPEEFERNLETFHEIETAEYERQKRFYDFERGLPFRDREILLGDFTCHGLEHVKEVMSEGERYIDALEKAGFEIPESLREVYGVSAKYHDIGMADSVGMELAKDLSEKVKQPDADLSKLEGFFNLDPNATLESTDARTKELVAAAGDDQNKVEAIESISILQTSIVEAKAVAERLRELPPNDLERAAAELVYRQKLSKIQDFVYDNLRSNHARRSAEYVLEHSDEFKERYGKNVNPRNVACAIMLHTKMNSGCGNLNARSFGMAEVEQLSVEEACSHLVADWNLNHGDRRVESAFSEADLKEIAFAASVLRTADNRRNGETATFTNGDRIVCETTKKGLALYHGEEKDGTVMKRRRVRNDKSVSIISAESCTQFGEIRPENGNMVHVMRFNGLGTAPLEQGFAENRVVDYVGEVESGVFMSGEKGVNIIEVQVPGASKSECARLEQEWTRSLQKFCEEDRGKKAKAVMQYYQPGRLRVVPADRREESL